MATKKATLLSLLLASTLLLAGCSSGGPGQPSANSLLSEKVATIDGTVITRQDYDAIYNQLGKMFHLSENADSSKNPVIQETLKRMTLNKLILNTLIRNDAHKLGVDVNEGDVQKFKDEQVKQVGGPEMLKQFLAQNKISEQDFESTLKEQILMNKFLEKKGGDSLKVSDQDAKAYYDTHPTEFNLPESIHASHILVKAIVPELKKTIREKDPKITDAALQAEVLKEKAALKAKAQQIYAQVQVAPNKLPELAQKYSDDVVSAKNGGDLDQLVQQTTDPAFWDAIKKTKPGTLYPGVVETQFGYHIIEVKDHANTHRQSFVEAKNTIVTKLSQEKKQHLLQDWVNEKKNKAQIVIEPKYQPVNPEQPPAPQGATTVPAPNAAAPAQQPAGGKS